MSFSSPPNTRGHSPNARFEVICTLRRPWRCARALNSNSPPLLSNGTKPSSSTMWIKPSLPSGSVSGRRHQVTPYRRVTSVAGVERRRAEDDESSVAAAKIPVVFSGDWVVGAFEACGAEDGAEVVAGTCREKVAARMACVPRASIPVA